MEFLYGLCQCDLSGVRKWYFFRLCCTVGKLLYQLLRKAPGFIMFLIAEIRCCVLKFRIRAENMEFPEHVHMVWANA